MRARSCLIFEWHVIYLQFLKPGRMLFMEAVFKAFMLQEYSGALLHKINGHVTLGTVGIPSPEAAFNGFLHGIAQLAQTVAPSCVIVHLIGGVLLCIIGQILF